MCHPKACRPRYCLCVHTGLLSHTHTHAQALHKHTQRSLLQKRLNAELQSKHEVMLEALVAERTYVDGKVAIVVGKFEQVRRWASADDYIVGDTCTNACCLHVYAHAAMHLLQPRVHTRTQPACLHA